MQKLLGQRNTKKERLNAETERSPRMNYMLDAGAYAPEKAHNTDAGYDLRSRDTILIMPEDSAVFDTGVHIQIPHGWCGLLVSKSGLNTKHNMTSTGLVDEGYTGSIRVKLYNHGSDPYMIREGDKISQLVLLPYGTFDMTEVDELDETERGDNGFGSTGR